MGEPIGHVMIDFEILSKEQILSEFFRKFLTLHWFQKKKPTKSLSILNTAYSHPRTNTFSSAMFSPNEIYSMLLSIGIHPSDTEHNGWIKSFVTDNNDDDDDNKIDDENIKIGIE